MLDKLNHLKGEMCDELMELTDKKNRSPGDVEMIGEIVDIILDIHRIEDYCEGGEYSRTGEWEADMRGTFGHDAGNGYNRGTAMPTAAVTMCADITPARMDVIA